MSIICTKTYPLILTQKRSFFAWINIIFNKVDEDRRRLVGPDRSCAEWLLRNGAQVKWTTSNEFLADYNSLPNEEVKLQIQEVDASGSSIMHYGFDHFKGCNHIKKVVLHKCSYLEDKALVGLAHLTPTLHDLQVSSSLNITDKGLKNLTALKNLKNLVLFDLPYVTDKTVILTELKSGLPQCNVKFD